MVLHWHCSLPCASQPSDLQIAVKYWFVVWGHVSGLLATPSTCNVTSRTHAVSTRHPVPPAERIFDYAYNMKAWLASQTNDTFKVGDW